MRAPAERSAVFASRGRRRSGGADGGRHCGSAFARVSLPGSLCAPSRFHSPWSSEWPMARVWLRLARSCNRRMQRWFAASSPGRAATLAAPATFHAAVCFGKPWHARARVMGWEEGAPLSKSLLKMLHCTRECLSPYHFKEAATPTLFSRAAALTQGTAAGAAQACLHAPRALQSLCRGTQLGSMGAQQACV